MRIGSHQCQLLIGSQECPTLSFPPGWMDVSICPPTISSVTFPLRSAIHPSTTFLLLLSLGFNQNAPSVWRGKVNLRHRLTWCGLYPFLIMTSTVRQVSADCSEASASWEFNPTQLWCPCTRQEINLTLATNVVKHTGYWYCFWDQ